MKLPVNGRIAIISVAAVTALLGSAAAFPQATEDSSLEDDEVIEEIIVYGGKKRGDPVDIAALYEELMLERLMLDQDQLRVLQEESDWREAEAELEEPSRIQWGYDPEEEMRMRRESELDNVGFVTTRPATVFRASF